MGSGFLSFNARMIIPVIYVLLFSVSVKADGAGHHDHHSRDHHASDVHADVGFYSAPAPSYGDSYTVADTEDSSAVNPLSFVREVISEGTSAIGLTSVIIPLTIIGGLLFFFPNQITLPAIRRGFNERRRDFGLEEDEVSKMFDIVTLLSSLFEGSE